MTYMVAEGCHSKFYNFSKILKEKINQTESKMERDCKTKGKERLKVK